MYHKSDEQSRSHGGTTQNQIATHYSDGWQAGQPRREPTSKAESNKDDGKRQDHPLIVREPPDRDER